MRDLRWCFNVIVLGHHDPIVRKKVKGLDLNQQSQSIQCGLTADCMDPKRRLIIDTDA